MNRRKRPLWPLIPSLLSLAGLVYLIFTYPPDFQFAIYSASWRIPVLLIFFLLLFTCLFFLIVYFFRGPRRATLISILVIVYLIFRMLHLNSPYFLLLLIALYASLELFFKKD